MVHPDDLKQISKDLKRYIIKEHMKTYYHWTVGLLSFVIGVLVGVIIS
jgi:hypothetical protein